MTAPPILLSTPLKFLVVDDSRAIQAIIRRAILKCGYEPVEVRTALDGEQALDIIESFVPDLVITDWHMPKVSGLEMVQALRQMGHKNVRVGFVTTEKTPALLDQAISNGAMFILHKPFGDAELATAVMSSVKDLAKHASAQPTGEPKKDSGPVLEPALHALLQTTLGKIPFRLIAGELMTVDKLPPNNLLGLYVATGHKGVYAIGVMDGNAVCMVGGGALLRLPPEVRSAMASGQYDEKMLNKANDFMRSVAQCMSETAAEQQVTVSMAKASVVKNTFTKLSEVLVQSGGRSDFRIAIPGYGEGRIAFFLVTP
jgi:CheY-like chemotaxis protein